MNPTALGDADALIRVYMGNKPVYDWPELLKSKSSPDILPLEFGHIKRIGDQCGNGWRKVFNVYAKFIYALGGQYMPAVKECQSWQQYRDIQLLQANSNTMLSFSYPDNEHSLASQPIKENGIHIIMGRMHAKSLNLSGTLQWLNPEFAVDTKHRILVCPYFDYRQLTNQKIIFLVNTIQQAFSELKNLRT